MSLTFHIHTLLLAPSYSDRMAGSQAKNLALMQLIANTCSVPVIVPHSPSSAVVLGAAILGRFAAEVSALGRKLSDYEQRRMLWSIMVRCLYVAAARQLMSWISQVEMTQPGQLIKPSVTPRERRLLGAKYKIFRETIETQKRWRKEMEEALATDD